MKVTSLASFAVGVQTLRANPMRTVLSTLGIIIGVAALVSILSLGDGLEAFSRQQIAETTDLQLVAVQPRTMDVIDGVAIRRDSVPSLTGAIAETLTRALGGRANASVSLSASLLVGWPADTARTATVVTGAAPAPPLATSDSVIAGRWLAADDADSAVVVLGSRVADDLDEAPARIVGRNVRVGSIDARVIGIVDGPNARRIARAWLPLDYRTTPLLDDGGRRVATMAVLSHSIEDVPAVEADTRAWFDSRFDNAEDDFTITTSRARVDQARQAIVVFKLAMGAITGIAILVGGIGIMNVLLASVHERTREIGVRRAAGARRNDIFLQFLAESVAVSGVGSIIGVVAGLGGAYGITAAIRRLTDAPVYAAFSWSTLVVAAAAAVFVGIAFGSYPAGHAARLSPMDAIRHE
jgi:putative ABC transport system permease protein